MCTYVRIYIFVAQRADFRNLRTAARQESSTFENTREYRGGGGGDSRLERNHGCIMIIPGN